MNDMRKIEIDLGELMDMYFAGITNYMNAVWLIDFFPDDLSRKDVEDYKMEHLPKDQGYADDDWYEADERFKEFIK